MFLGTQQPRSLVATLVALGLTSVKALAWKIAALLGRPFARQLLLGSEAHREA